MLGCHTAPLYFEVRARGRRGKLWSRLTGRSRRLLSLDEVESTCTVHDRRYAGLQTVPIERILGSEGRDDDFDRDFNPLGEHNRERWMSVANAWDRGVALPPVELIQVGDAFFVRDGHHRISVGRTVGQRVIDAEVTVWHVDGPLPRETAAATPSPASSKAQVARHYRQIRNSLANLRQRLAHLISTVGQQLSGQTTTQLPNP
jgi:hypothetical protein